jgi:hypothetical protein
MPAQREIMAASQPRYRIELLCDDGDWLIVAQNLTRSEADRQLASKAGNGRRYRITDDGRQHPQQ